jgi:predicted DNA-binding transcriptional regulator AlpA
MNIEQTLKHLIKEAVREVIEEEIQRGRLLPANKPEPTQPSTVKKPLKSRDPNSIIRPNELTELLAVSRATLWRWEQSDKLPPRVHLSSRAFGWRYGDIVEWLKRR